MKKIKRLEYAYGNQPLDTDIYVYEVDGKQVTKIDYPDVRGFATVHKTNDGIEFIKAPYMKLSTFK